MVTGLASISSFLHLFITARKRSLRRLCFYRCLSFCPRGGGACVVAREVSGYSEGVGVCGCSGGGVCGCSGGHAWLLWGACMVAWGHAWLLPGGVCMVARWMCMVAPGGACVGYNEIWRYDQWAGGMHPTGMHSCFLISLSLHFFISIYLSINLFIVPVNICSDQMSVTEQEFYLC